MIEHYLILVTDDYAGNYEREMAGFVFGVSDPDLPRYDEFKDRWTEQERADAALFGGDSELEGICSPMIHEEYGPVMVDLDPADSSNLLVKIEDELWGEVTPEVIEKVKQRAQRFCEEIYHPPHYDPEFRVRFSGLRHRIRAITEADEVL